MHTLNFIFILTCNSLLLNSVLQPNADKSGPNSSQDKVAQVNQEPEQPKYNRHEVYQLAIERVAATKSMRYLHANYAQLGSPFSEMPTAQFADLYYRSHGFTLPGTQDAIRLIYTQRPHSETPAISDPEPYDPQKAYQRILERIAANESMKNLHAHYAELGMPFLNMTTIQFADVFYRSQGFTLPGTREVIHCMYLQRLHPEIPELTDPEPDDCTPEEIEAWYREFYDPWFAKRPDPSPWVHELPFVDPMPHQRVKPGFTVYLGRGYRWGIVFDTNERGDFVAIGQLKADYKPEPTKEK